LIVFDPKESVVWGIVCLFDWDVWMITLTNRYDGEAGTIIYQKAVVNGGGDDWSEVLPIACMSRLEWMASGGLPSNERSLSDSYCELYHKAVEYVELNDESVLIEHYFRPWLKEGSGIFSRQEVFEVLEFRLKQLFSWNKDGWRSEWPRIRSDFLEKLERQEYEGVARDAGHASGAEVVRWVISAYRELFRRCVLNIGKAGHVVTLH
jgi:hypothetical protein